VEWGEVVGIIGFFGLGKMTMFRCVNLLEKLLSGYFMVDG